MEPRAHEIVPLTLTLQQIDCVGSGLNIYYVITHVQFILLWPISRIASVQLWLLFHMLGSDMPVTSEAP